LFAEPLGSMRAVAAEYLAGHYGRQPSASAQRQDTHGDDR